MPCKELTASGETYYFMPARLLSRKEPQNEEVGGFFCGYLAD
jgi:hypothetical protein